MGRLSKIQFDELYDAADKIFAGDTERVNLLANYLDDATTRSILLNDQALGELNATKIILFAYAQYGRNRECAWQDISRTDD